MLSLCKITMSFSPFSSHGITLYNANRLPPRAEGAHLYKAGDIEFFSKHIIRKSTHYLFEAFKFQYRHPFYEVVLFSIRAYYCRIDVICISIQLLFPKQHVTLFILNVAACSGKTVYAPIVSHQSHISFQSHGIIPKEQRNELIPMVHTDPRRKYIEAAAQLIRECGEENVSARKLASVLGTASSTIHRHFKTLDELIVYAAIHYRYDTYAEIDRIAVFVCTCVEMYKGAVYNIRGCCTTAPVSSIISEFILISILPSGTDSRQWRRIPDFALCICQPFRLFLSPTVRVSGW